MRRKITVMCTPFDNRQYCQLREYAQTEESLLIADALSRLPPLEQAIVVNYFGFDGVRGRTIKGIARNLSIPYRNAYWAYRSACHKLGCDETLKQAFTD